MRTVSRIAEIALDIPTKALDRTYTYAIPEESWAEKIDVGCVVQVSFAGRTAIGFVMRIHDLASSAIASMRRAEAENVIDLDKLKDIEAVLSRPYFGPFGAKCARFLAKEYLAPLSSCVRLFAPPGAIPRVVKGEDGKWTVLQPVISEVDDRWITAGEQLDEFKPKSNATKQIAVLDVVRQGDIRASELKAMLGGIDSTLSALSKHDAIKIEKRRRIRSSIPSEPSEIYHATAVAQDPTPSQRAAIDAISKAYDAKDGQVVLVDGVTGSGKTEVYLQAIERVLEDGRSAIVLVPEISLTPQTVARFRGRFGDIVAVLHSKMAAGERFDSWDLIRTGEARVVVGARSALFAPVQDLGLIVIDEEHETSYKQESAPRYVSREVAQWMIDEVGGTLILGSATPSIESLYCANKLENWTHVVMSERATGSSLPDITVVDMAAEFHGGRRSIFSTKLKSSVITELKAGHKVVLLLNQRGYAQFLLCRDCGFVPKCSSCSTTLTYHQQGNSLVCHHCGRTLPAPPKCPSCESPYLKKYGVGTQQVEDELRALLGAELGSIPEITGFGEQQSQDDIPIIRMDADTTTAKGAHRRLLERFGAADAAVLLGTQMIAKGLDFDDVTLVGVINVDTQLHLPDFRANERTFDLIEQVAGRAGRAQLPGRVIVQTYEPDNYAIRAAAAYDRDLFLRNELPRRKVLQYPPYIRMANVLVWGKDESSVKQRAEDLFDLLQFRVRREGGGWEVLAATPCVFSKIRDDHRWHILVKCPTGADLPSVIGDGFTRDTPIKGVNVAVDIDPYDLL